MPARASKPSSVLDGHLSRGPCGPRVRRRLRTGSRLSPDSASSRLVRADRRLLQGGLPFSPRPRRDGLGFCCSHSAGCPDRVPVWTVRAGACGRPCPRLHEAPCCMQLGLSSTSRGRQRPSCAHRRVLSPHAPSHYTETAWSCQAGSVGSPVTRPTRMECPIEGKEHTTGRR